MTDNRSEFVLDTFRVQGLDEHNRSLDWIVENAEKLGANAFDRNKNNFPENKH